MTKRGIACTIADRMRSEGYKKKVPLQKFSFRIIDENNNEGVFDIKRNDKEVSLCVDDVEAVLDELLLVIEEAVRSGEKITLYGLGTLFLHYRPGRRAKNMNTGEWYYAKGIYVPKINFSPRIKAAAKSYGLLAEERGDNIASLDEDGDSDG